MNYQAASKEERAAYMREYRKKNPKPKKRIANLDRSKPNPVLAKLDRGAYMRQYMRWVRAGKPSTSAELLPKSDMHL